MMKSLHRVSWFECFHLRYWISYSHVSLDNYLSPALSGQEDNILEFEHYLESELPKMIKQKLESIIQGRQGTLEIQIMKDLVEIIHACQAQLYQSYVGRNASDASMLLEQRDLDQTESADFDFVNYLEYPALQNYSASQNFSAPQVYQVPPPLAHDFQIINSQVNQDINISRTNGTRQLADSVDDSGFSSHHAQSYSSQGQNMADTMVLCRESQSIFSEAESSNYGFQSGGPPGKANQFVSLPMLEGGPSGITADQSQLHNMDSALDET
jgi:hypothetical protein